MKILSIGNSFSQDAQRYLHGIAASAGDVAKCVNLYIGGCTLKAHYVNLFAQNNLYNLSVNGEALNIYVNIREVLLSDDWDVITLQQQSLNSCKFDTMRPYIKKIADEIRFLCPNAKLYLHQTWGYENGSQKLANAGYTTMSDMFFDIRSSYAEAFDFIDADGIIPSGEAMLALCDAGVKAHRDTFHATLGAGRYLLGLVWFEKLFGKSCIDNTFSDFDEQIDAKTLALCKKIAHEMSSSNN